MTIDEYRKLVSPIDPSIVRLHEAATNALAVDIHVDLSKRPLASEPRANERGAANRCETG